MLSSRICLYFAVSLLQPLSGPPAQMSPRLVSIKLSLDFDSTQKSVNPGGNLLFFFSLQKKFESPGNSCMQTMSSQCFSSSPVLKGMDTLAQSQSRGESKSI